MALKKIQIAPEALLQYFGRAPGGVNLSKILRAVSPVKIQGLALIIDAVRAARGSIFIFGNGGSFDNSELFARKLSELFCGARIRIRTADRTDRFFDGAYDQIFRTELHDEDLRPGDLVIGISGSGNSPNILEAFRYAQEREARLFALGGRDGGEMCRMVGAENSIIAPTSVMEAIEDTHLAIILILLESMRNGEPVTVVQGRFVSMLDQCIVQGALAEHNHGHLAEVASQVLRGILAERRLFVIGAGVGARHLRADCERGFTGALPIRGCAAPELFTTNSGMASANDDGIEFILAHGLSRFNPTPDDYGLALRLPRAETMVDNACSILKSAGTPFLTVGAQSGCDIDFHPLVDAFDSEWIPTVIGHALGVTIRETLQSVFKVTRAPELKSEVPWRGRRKITFSEVLELEERLRAQGRLASDRVLTFAYGELFSAKDPAVFGVARGHY